MMMYMYLVVHCRYDLFLRVITEHFLCMIWATFAQQTDMYCTTVPHNLYVEILSVN